MSKRRREAMERPELSKSAETAHSADSLSAGKSGWWRDLKTGHRWLAIGVIAFLSIGVLGAGMKYLDDSAREEIARQKQNPLAKQNKSLLAKINPFMPLPTPNPTPQLSKDYVYAGSRLVAVEDAGASAIPPADLAVWRPSNGYWYCLGGTNSAAFTTAWGTSGDEPVQGDYDGDGKTDLAIFRPTTGMWWIYPSGGASAYTVTLGATCTPPTGCDRLVPADFDGDGKTDPAVFHQGPSLGYWNIYFSGSQSTVSLQFGLSTDIPAPADFDGDGKADLGVWRASNTTFYALGSQSGQWLTTSIGSSTDTIMVPGDYDGDGKADFALRSGNDWLIRQSSDNQLINVTWYGADFKQVQNDYDGDGKMDIAVWKGYGKGLGNWFIRQSSRLGQSNELRITNWGTTDDIPVPALYRR